MTSETKIARHFLKEAPAILSAKLRKSESNLAAFLKRQIAHTKHSAAMQSVTFGRSVDDVLNEQLDQWTSIDPDDAPLPSDSQLIDLIAVMDLLYPVE